MIINSDTSNRTLISLSFRTPTCRPKSSIKIAHISLIIVWNLYEWIRFEKHEKNQNYFFPNPYMHFRRFFHDESESVGRIIDLSRLKVIWTWKCRKTQFFALLGYCILKSSCARQILRPDLDSLLKITSFDNIPGGWIGTLVTFSLTFLLYKNGT